MSDRGTDSDFSPFASIVGDNSNGAIEKSDAKEVYKSVGMKESTQLIDISRKAHQPVVTKSQQENDGVPSIFVSKASKKCYDSYIPVPLSRDQHHTENKINDRNKNDNKAGKTTYTRRKVLSITWQYMFRNIYY